MPAIGAREEEEVWGIFFIHHFVVHTSYLVFVFTTLVIVSRTNARRLIRFGTCPVSFHSRFLSRLGRRVHKHIFIIVFTPRCSSFVCDKVSNDAFSSTLPLRTIRCVRGFNDDNCSPYKYWLVDAYSVALSHRTDGQGTNVPVLSVCSEMYDVFPDEKHRKCLVLLNPFSKLKRYNRAYEF